MVSNLITQWYGCCQHAPSSSAQRAVVAAGPRRAGQHFTCHAGRLRGRANDPRVDTLDRILRAAGYASDITTSGRPDATDAEREAKGRELLQVLDLAAQFPPATIP